jgi:hypothetical protein
MHLLENYGVRRSDFYINSAHGKSKVLKAKHWPKELLQLINNDIGRRGFLGVILVVDSDSDDNNMFDAYERNDILPYIDCEKPKKIALESSCWLLDNLAGYNPIPILGINVPFGEQGCLETDLLDSYGFPKEGQPEYTSLVRIIQIASLKWNIPKMPGGEDWWVVNKKAKLDKFIYSALSRGFYICRQKTSLPNEPPVISHLKAAMNYNNTQG